MPMRPGSILLAPTTPSTVRVAPDDRCTSIPSSISRAITESICCSVARSFMTTTMTFSSDPVPAFALLSLGAASLVDDALEDAHDGFRCERPGKLGGRLPDRRQHLRLAVRLIHRQPHVVFQAPHFNGARHPHVQQPHQLPVDDVNPVPQVLDRQAFSQRTYSSTRVSRSAEAPASAITFTSALPTTAASAQRPTSRTCSGVEMPKPSATGRSLTARMRRTICSAPSAIWSRTPVTPRREMA